MKKQVIFGIALALAILSCLPMQGQEKKSGSSEIWKHGPLGNQKYQRVGYHWW